MEYIDLTKTPKRKKETTKSSDDTKTVKQVIYMLVAVVVFFVICWGPILVDSVLIVYDFHPSPEHKIDKYRYLTTAFHLMAYFNR